MKQNAFFDLALGRHRRRDPVGADKRFFWRPINTKENKAVAEVRQMEIIRENGAKLVVLARYMRILSDERCKTISARIINIHRSFLPRFKEKSVKLTNLGGYCPPVYLKALTLRCRGPLHLTFAGRRLEGQHRWISWASG
jgi:hypothetical protein